MFRLALALGMTVTELGRRMTSYELAEWAAFYQLEPFGEARSDLRAGMISSTIANCMTKRRGQGYRPSDFMVDFDKQHQPEAPRDDTDAKAAFDHYKRLFEGSKRA